MRTLLVGNTGYITNEFIEEAFPESLVMVLGDAVVKTNRRKNLLVRPFTQSEEELEDLFHRTGLSPDRPDDAASYKA